ncbi:hypothetical protein AGMMS49546_22990 [Spirochaetia bacterium]|nr:hypothetical protein AGMMS49546_22990 [Spirochaetia bacterium]
MNTPPPPQFFPQIFREYYKEAYEFLYQNKFKYIDFYGMAPSINIQCLTRIYYRKDNIFNI